MNCPVCNSGLSEGAMTCSSCNSDLESYSHIENLDTQVKKNIQVIRILGGLLLLFIILCAWMLSKNPGVSVQKPANGDEIAKLKNENSQLQTAINELKKLMEEKDKQLQTTPAENKTSSAIHIVTNGESLWTIAVKELNDGNKYLQIAKDNNIQDPNKISTGMELKINK